MASALFQPLALRGLELRNRIVISPLCEYSAVEGCATDWHVIHLGHLALSGAGLLIIECTAVEPRGRISRECLGLYSDASEQALARVLAIVRRYSTMPIGIQLGHAGRKVSTKAPWEGFEPLTEEDAKHGKPPWRGYAPSPVPAKPGGPVPIEMDHADIRRVVQAHVEACRRSLDAGFDILEIHGAHGYIIQQFLSPITNLRKDAYGGDLQGRMRFCLELVEAVRAAWPKELPLFFRASCIDGKGGAWNIDDTVQLARELKARGVDLIDCSSGGIQGPLTLSLVPRVPGYHVPFAERIRGEAGIATMAPGLITEAQQAEDYLQAGKTDLIALARELLWNPSWPAHAAKALGAADPLALLPKTYAWWLRRREDVRGLSK